MLEAVVKMEGGFLSWVVSQLHLTEQMSEEPQALWTRVAREIVQDTKTDCEYWLSRLSPRYRGLTADEGFMLLSSLGSLKFHRWSVDLPKDEADGIAVTSMGLQAKLCEAVTRIGRQLTSTIEKGFGRVIDDLEQSIVRYQNLAEEEKLGDWEPELEHDVFYVMDGIGYAAEFLKETNIRLSADFDNKLNQVTEHLRALFPEAVRQTREMGHAINERRPVFPQSFWWRREYLPDALSHSS